jgi:gliding motility-associated-like protein
MISLILYIIMYNMRNKYNCISVVSTSRAILLALFVLLSNVISAQQSPSIQTGVSFQWANTQTNLNDPATIQSVTIDGTIYNTFVVPTSYELTRLGPDGHNPNRILLNGGNVGGNSSGLNWNTDAINAFQDKNLNHYFTAIPNGRNICLDFNAATTTDAQKQTIFYSPSIPSNEGGLLGVTERGGNNCFYIEAWGIPATGGPEQLLGKTFVRSVGDYRNCSFGPPTAGSDYWQSGRCNENGQTIGIGLFYLDDIAPTGSRITKIEFVASSRDHGDGKFFIMQKYAVDQQNTNCINSSYSGTVDISNNVPENSTYSIVSGPTIPGQSFIFNSDGTYTYEPTPGFTGDVTFEYQVCLPAPNTSVCDSAFATISFVDSPPIPEGIINCASGNNNFSISVTSPLGAEYEYSLNNGTYQNSPDFNNLPDGSYTIFIRNVFTTCENFNTVPLVIDNLELTGTTTDILCRLDAAGVIDISISGGTPPYTYSWSNSATTEDLIDIVGGTYTVTVTDANGCTISDDFTVNQPTDMLDSTITSATDVLCNGDGTGEIDLTVNGGTPPYTYLWNTGDTSEDLVNVIAGAYSVTVTDANGCTTTSQSTILEPTEKVSGSITQVTNVECLGENTGSLIAEGSGGIPPYTYSIDNGVTSQTSGLFENLTAGNYTVLVTDANGCTFNINATVGADDIESPEITVPITITIEACAATDITNSNGVFPYSSIQSGDVQSTFTNNIDYNASDDFNIQLITYIDVITSTTNCPITILRTFTITDNCNNTATATQTITVQDTTPPTLSLPSDITIECTEDETSANTGVAVGMDNCSTITITESDTITTSCGNTKTIIRTWTATDECGNATSADQTIIVEDTTPPAISGPADVTIECSEDESSANTGEATASDTCGDVTISQSDVETSACGNTKTIVRTWTATDTCGNTTSADQTITVQDTTPPTILVPANVTIECTEDESSANTGEADANDTCGDVTISQSDVETAACGNTKTIVRTWIATDACGNTTSADQTITVQDTTPPTISAPADVTIECTEDESSTNTGEANGSDTCGDVTISQSDNVTMNCGNTKTIIRTWTVTDSCGNITSADQTITVQDTTPPSISVPADVTIDCSSDETSANTGEATGTDTCGDVIITQSDLETAACGNTKTIIRTWTATDDCGNTISANQTITVQDTTPPSITAPADITIECIEDESSTNTGEAIGSDTCGDVIISQSDIETASCGNTKTIIRTWIAIDECGNATSADQTIIIQDTTPPAIDNSGVQNIDIQCGVTPDGVFEAWLINNAGATATDLCGTVTWSNDFDANADLDCASGGITVIFTATDDCDNIATTTATYSIIDTVDPVLTLPTDITIECTEDTTPTNTGTATATDDCDSPNVTFSDSETATCGNTKTIVRTWTATDACGNTTSANQTIIVQDTIPPTFTVPADITIECDVDVTDLTLTGDVTDETDNCASGLDATYTDAVSAGSCPNASIITRTWSLSDECDNTTTLVQTINVIDTTPPTFTVPVDVTIECDVDMVDLTLTGDVTDEADNCTLGMEASYTDSIVDGNCANESIITRTWSLSDACDNTTTLVQTITIQDTTAPTFTVPADVTIECDVDTTDLTITGEVTDESDNCSIGIEATFSDVTLDGSCANTYTIQRTWTLEDECGNAASLLQTITIQDTTPPTFTVPADITLECDVDITNLSITGSVSDEADNCDSSMVATYTDSIAAGSCANASIITRTWSLADDCNNTTVLVQTITVQDTTPPEFDMDVLPADVTVECDAIPDPGAMTLTATDNCGTATVTVVESTTTGTCANEYTLIRSWTATDDCGNEAMHIQTITVQDTSAPTFNEALPADINVECDAIPTVETLTASDNCSSADIAFEETTTEGACIGDFIIERTWLAIDSCGNEAVHTQIITVQDNTAPTLVTPFDENITVACDDIPTVPDLVFEDSCSNDINVAFNEVSNQVNDFEDYSIIRTWTLTDNCGNESQFVQTINVQIGNVISTSDANRCILDIEFDLFDLLAGDFDMNGTWSIASGVATINGSLFDPSTVEVGIYIFKYAITEGSCPTEVEVTVTIDDDCVVLPCGEDDVVISKTVTANGDTINDVFEISGVDDCNFVIELQIFNRWGAEIYKNNNYQNNWGGEAHGSSAGSSGYVPTGTYYYIINLRNSGLKPFAGPIYVATNK